MSMNNSNQFEYDVALSFAGEDRTVVEKFADLLIEKNIKVFWRCGFTYKKASSQCVFGIHVGGSTAVRKA